MDRDLLVRDDGVVLPAVPQLGGHLHELRGPLVPAPVCGGVVETEVLRRIGACRRDDVPAGSSAADEVEGREPPRQVVRLVVAGRRGRDQTDLLGGRGDRREDDRRLQLAARLRSGLLNSTGLSARNTESNFPRSAVCANEM